MVPLVFNRAQRHIHEQLEAQKAKTGKVRALILKGRQQGCSTYVGGRFYHRITHARGLRVYILTHEEAATTNLFEMVDLFLRHCDDPPSISVANANELYFDELDSGYKVATAGTKGVGRSSTLQLFHGSEVALWPYAADARRRRDAGVADRPGTEIILESTAHGVGNLFHKMWRDAETRSQRVPRDLRALVLGRRIPQGGRARLQARRGRDRIRRALRPQCRADGVA